MSADFWAGYVSGAVGILLGNPLDLIKTRLQASRSSTSRNVINASTSSASASAATTTSGDLNIQSAPIIPSNSSSTTIHRSSPHTASTISTPLLPRSTHTAANVNIRSLTLGASAPILTYGALNALLFITYNRALAYLSSSSYPPSPFNPPSSALPNYAHIYMAGLAGGLATFVVSAPTEVIKVRTQTSRSIASSTTARVTSWNVAKEIVRQEGFFRGLYRGGVITSLRDGIGYGWYFVSYEAGQRLLGDKGETGGKNAWKTLLCGGLAGIVTWASIFPLDVIKTRVQESGNNTFNTWKVAVETYQEGGVKVFFRGLGVCSIRAFIVNAVQWSVYEWIMYELSHKD